MNDVFSKHLAHAINGSIEEIASQEIAKAQEQIRKRVLQHVANIAVEIHRRAEVEFGNGSVIIRIVMPEQLVRDAKDMGVPRG